MRLLFFVRDFPDSVEPQMSALRGGLARVVALELLHPFDECELEWLVGGLPHLDLADWRAHTVYKAGYTDQVAIIIWFWQVSHTPYSPQKNEAPQALNHNLQPGNNDTGG